MVDIKQIKFICDHIGMYCSGDQKGIIDFINGYEVGKGNNEITNSITNYLVKHYKFKQNALGWPGLIEKYVRKYKISWVDGFIELINKLENGDKRVKNSKNKKKIIKYTFRNKNVIEIIIFENHENSNTANIFIRSFMNMENKQEFLFKIEPIDQTSMILELRNSKYKKSAQQGDAPEPVSELNQ